MKHYFKNKKYLSVIIIISITLMLLILGTWHIILYNFTRHVNQGYSNQNIAIYHTDENNVNASFTSIKSRINLLSVEFDINGLTIHNNNAQISYEVPINIKYSVLSGALTIKYNGKCNSQVLTSTESGNGDVIKLNLAVLSKVNLPIIKILQQLIKVDLIPTINYLDQTNIILDEYVVYTKDDASNIKTRIYESFLELSCSNSPYYSKIDDIWYNLPQNYSINGNLKVEYLNSMQKVQDIELKASFHALGNRWTVDDILSTGVYGEVNIDKFNYSDSKLSIFSKLNYQSMLTTISAQEIKLNTECIIAIKDKEHVARVLMATLVNPNDRKKLYFDFSSLVDMIGHNYQEGLNNFLALYTHSSTVDSNIYDYLEQLNQLYDVNDLQIPEKLKFGMSCKVMHDTNQLSIKLDNLEISLDNLSIKIGSLLWDSNRRKDFTANLYLLNFKDLINFITDFKIAKSKAEYKLYLSSQLTASDITADYSTNYDFTEELKLAENYRDAMKSFLLRISNLPKIGNNFLPNSRVIYLKYQGRNFNPQQRRNKFIIGNMAIQDIQKLYYLTLYDTAKEVANKSNRPGKIIQEFFPQLQHNKDLIDKLENSHKLIDSELWLEILHEIVKIYSTN